MRRLVWISALIAVVASCSNDDLESVNPALIDIVTFEGNDNGGAVFTFNRIDDSPLITLHCDKKIDTEKVEEGSRLLIKYTPADGLPYSSGEITLHGGAMITDAKVVTDRKVRPDEWESDEVYVYSLWRTGGYINLRCRLAYDENPRTFALVADPLTVEDAEPQLYLVHKTGGDINSFERTYYASFDISSIWNRSTCRGVVVNVANSNLKDKKQFKFNKSSI